MENLSIGDKLPDYEFYDLDMNIQKLSEIVMDVTVLSFVDPTCGTCLDQSLTLQETIENPIDYMRFISISSTNALLLKEYKEEYGFKPLMLLDENKEYQHALGVTIAPFNIVVNDQLIVIDVVTGAMTREDIHKVIDNSNY